MLNIAVATILRMVRRCVPKQESIENFILLLSLQNNEGSSTPYESSGLGVSPRAVFFVDWSTPFFANATVICVGCVVSLSVMILGSFLSIMCCHSLRVAVPTILEISA